MSRCQCCQQAELIQLDEVFIDYLSEQDFQIWRCPHCQSMETRGLKQSQDYYGQAYYGSEKGKFNPWLEKIFKANHHRNAKKLYKAAGQPKNVLEIGCGRAYILKALKNLGCQVQGLESADAAAWILNNPDIKVTGIRTDKPWPVADNSQDLVIIWHVLEHVNDPNQVLAQIYQSLKPGAILCVSVPNCGALQARLNFSSWFHLDVPRHLFHFSAQGLESSLKRQQFEIMARENGELTQNLYGWWQSLANLSSRPYNNVLYRWLQGSGAWQACPRKAWLWRQLITAPLWLPLGLLGYLWESVSHNTGTMTIYARKPHNNDEPAPR